MGRLQEREAISYITNYAYSWITYFFPAPPVQDYSPGHGKPSPRMVISTSSGRTPKLCASAFLASAIVMVLPIVAFEPEAVDGSGLNFRPAQIDAEFAERLVGHRVAGLLVPDPRLVQQRIVRDLDHKPRLAAIVLAVSPFLQA